MVVLISLVLKSLIAWWCYSIADEKGRNAGLAAILGFFLGLFALVGYFIVESKNNSDYDRK